MRICTIIARNYLAQARVLALSYAEHNGGAPCSVLVIDDPGNSIDDTNEPFDVVRIEDLGIERFDAMAAMYEVIELATAVKPWLLRLLLERHGEPVAYLDPDVCFYAGIEHVVDLAREHGLVLTPHVAHTPVPRDGLIPSELHLLIAGTYNLGFIALGPGATAGRLLAWWSERLRFDCIVEPQRGLFVDQRWMDLVDSVVSDFCVLRDPGCNAAYWNLHEREIERGQHGYEVNGEPLRFFHFSGYDPDRPFLLSRHQTRVRLSDEPVLAELFDRYGEAVRAQGFAQFNTPTRSYKQLHDETRLFPVLRRLYRDGERRGRFRHSPFTELGTDEFAAWCCEPVSPGGRHGVTRLALAIYRSRPDLSSAYPDLDGKHGASLVEWMHDHAGVEFGLREHWLPPRPRSRTPALVQELEPWGVNVAGYLRSELGVGEAARTVIGALDVAGVPVMPIQVPRIPYSRQGHEYSSLNAVTAAFPVNLVCVNADQLPVFIDDVGPDFRDGRYTIGLWWWEVADFPTPWMNSFDLVDEVWVGTEHVADALRAVSPVPVTKVKMPVTRPSVVQHTREELGLPEGFVFLFMFDFYSVFERKNPLATIEAFRRAFRPGSGASLVMKCINREGDPDNYERMLAAAADHPDVHVIDRYISTAEKNSMLAAADCYVSLHRAEGFGLTPAEAMCLGKPVMATRYSGNLDYMTDANSYLVDCKLQPVGDSNPPYPARAHWAEPDVEHAAALMREIVEDPQEARRRGECAAADIKREHSPEATGEHMARRLETIRARMRTHPPHRRAREPMPPLDGLAGLETLVKRGPDARMPTSGGPLRRLLSRGAMRLIAPAIQHQRELDARIVKTLGLASMEINQRERTQRAELRAEERKSGAQAASLLAELRRRDAQLAQLRAELSAIEPQSTETPSAQVPELELVDRLRAKR